MSTRKYLTLSTLWHDLPMLAVIALVFVKRDLRTNFYLAFDPDEAYHRKKFYRSVRKLIQKTGTVQSEYPGDPPLETAKDMLWFNAYVIGFDKFDMPFL